MVCSGKTGPSAEDFASASQEGFWAGVDRWRVVPRETSAIA